MIDYREQLKAKLGTALDQLEDSDGFVLVATAQDVSFTYLKAGGWSGHVLELEPLDVAEAKQELDRLRYWQTDAERRKKQLQEEIAVKEQRLADIDAALAKALGTP